MIARVFIQRKQPYLSVMEIADFQMPDKTSDTIKYLPDILKIHWTSCLGSRVQIC